MSETKVAEPETSDGSLGSEHKSSEDTSKSIAIDFDALRNKELREIDMWLASETGPVQSNDPMDAPFDFSTALDALEDVNFDFSTTASFTARMAESASVGMTFKGESGISNVVNRNTPTVAIPPIQYVNVNPSRNRPKLNQSDGFEIPRPPRFIPLTAANFRAPTLPLGPRRPRTDVEGLTDWLKNARESTEREAESTASPTPDRQSVEIGFNDGRDAELREIDVWLASETDPVQSSDPMDAPFDFSTALDALEDVNFEFSTKASFTASMAESASVGITFKSEESPGPRDSNRNKQPESRLSTRPTLTPRKRMETATSQSVEKQTDGNQATVDPRPSTSASANPPDLIRPVIPVYFPPVPEPQVLCADGKSACQTVLEEESSIPCRRCHREFYCSNAHLVENMEAHKARCPIPSSLRNLYCEDPYAYWLKHAAPNLYDTCLSFVLIWPALTVQWLPTKERLEDDVTRYQLCLGTHTNGSMNHLLLCAGSHKWKVHGVFTRGEVNRARFMPQKINIMATKSPSADVFLFDCDRCSDLPEDDSFKHILRLRGHSKEGFGLAWNPTVPGKLLSGSDDGTVCLWDTNSSHQIDSNGDTFCNALSVLRAHGDVVADVAWHKDNPSIFASVGNDKKILLWDTRADGREHLVEKDNAHDGDINCVNFSPFVGYVFSTGGADKVVKTWDMRALKRPTHRFIHHKEEVTKVEWSPHNSSIIASSGKDHRVFLWDSDKMSKYVPKRGDVDDPPQELIFIHGGHSAEINDIGWSSNEVGMIASVSEDNILQVWKPTDMLGLNLQKGRRRRK